MMMTAVVHRQHPPFYIVKSNGTCVEYTDDRKVAHEVYSHCSQLDRSMYRIDAKGMVRCLKRMIGGRELGNQVPADPT